MKKLLCTALIGMVILSGGCGQGFKDGFNSTYKPKTVEEKSEPVEEQSSTNITKEQVEDEIEKTVEEQEAEQPSIDEYLSTLEGKYIYEDTAMSGEKITQNTSVTYSEENRNIEIDINLTFLDPNVDAYGYIIALINGQYPDTMEDTVNIAIKEVNQASDMAYELGYDELPAHISCTIFIKDVPIVGAFQGIADDETKVYYRIDQDK